MQVNLINIHDIKPYENNPRLNEEAVGPVLKSIGEFGFTQPILIDANNIIVCGHTRYKAALKLGLEEVPCIQLSELTPAQVKAYRIADNKTGEFAKWDIEGLLQEFESLTEQEYDLGLTGFSNSEVDSIMESIEEDLRQAEDDDFNLEDNVPEEPFSQRGDLWILGKHRLVCGDSTQPKDVEILMDHKKANLIVTDPPYNVDYQGKTKENLSIENDNMGNEEFYNFLAAVYKNLYDSAEDGCGIYVFHADTEGMNFRKAMQDAGFKLSECCVWVKNSMVLGRQDYHWQHEPVLYGWKPTGPHHWYGDRAQTTVWNFERPTKSTEHPTMKPIPLVSYPIKNSSKKGDIILDLFGGSGSTLVAAQQLDRVAYLMELDPKYVDVIVKRYLGLTKDKDIQLIRGGCAIAYDGISEKLNL